MNVLLIPDTFKDSLTAHRVAEAMEMVVYERYPDSKVFTIAASDGGEGFLESLSSFLPKLAPVFCDTVDPLGRPIRTDYLIDRDNGVAYIELARASGIELLRAGERDPLKTSTYGTGLQIKHALKQGALKVFVGLGGSATNDGGAGLASALGFGFFDREDQRLTPNGGNLIDIFRIEPSTLATEASIYAVNDVLNPLYGPEGAAYTYARQKGADERAVELLDSGLKQLSGLVIQAFKRDVAHEPGCGAAGGTAYGLKVFLGAAFIPGVHFILEAAGFKELLQNEAIDLILTGEGCIDRQTPYGKLVSGVSREGNRYGIPVMAICGKLTLPEADWRELGLSAVTQLYDPEKPEGYSFEHAYSLVKDRTHQLMDHYSQAIRG